MDYERAYNALIRRAQERSAEGVVTERHHILPRCIGGGNEPENLVDLTLREHYVAHLLLAKIHGGVLWYAVQMMGAITGRRCSRMYERARTECLHLEKARWADPEFRRRMAEAKTDPEFIERKKAQAKLQWASPEFRERMKKVMATPEYREKLSEARKGRKLSKKQRESCQKQTKGKHFQRNIGKSCQKHTEATSVQKITNARSERHPNPNGAILRIERKW